ncbi:hypothetical protein ACOSP7_009020 [Xanthoceras sorbifolium]
MVQEAYDEPSGSICYPGSEIPEWFSFQSTESFITLELQPGWFNNNFVGFAVCTVVAFREHENDGLGCSVCCDYGFKCQDGHWHEASCGMFGWGDGFGGPSYVRSDHVFMGYDFQINPNNSGLGCSYNEVSIKFYLENNNFEKLECCEVTKCGVRLLYVQDIGEPSGSFRSDDEDEFWDCMETPSESLLSSDDEDQFWEAMEEH